MANIFDVDNAPTIEPTQFSVGDFVQWKRTDLAGDYPPASYSAALIARLKGGSSEITVAATEATDYYLFTVASTTSAGFTAGDYSWQVEITKTATGDRAVVARGEWKILADLDETGADTRSHAQIMLTKIESLLSGRADKDVSSYSIAGRSISKMSISDLLQWRDYYKREVTRERRESDIARGKSPKTTVKVRFL